MEDVLEMIVPVTILVFAVCAAFILLILGIWAWHEIAPPALKKCPRCKKLNTRKEWAKGCFYCNKKP